MKRTQYYTFAILMAMSLTYGCDRNRCNADTTAITSAHSVLAEVKAPSADTAAHSGPLPVHSPDVQVRTLKGNSLHLATEGLSLAAHGDAVQRSAVYSVTSLAQSELPPLPQGMVNLTAAAAGYRLLPGGEHFSPAAELRVAYDPDRIPAGYTPDDIHTSYYDSAQLAWVRLERIGVDTASHEIVSLTTHFTDFINELLKAPEMPETQAFVPTAMTDLEAVNPMEGLMLFQPPTANQEGTANLSYPIWTPQGRNGMQPNLALTYSSSGGNGWLGVGWDISVPEISLDTRWGVPRYSPTHETEIYLFAGDQLVNKDGNGAQIPLPHRTNQQQSRMAGDVRFYARTGDAHDSIIRHGNTPSDYWWEIVDRTGVVHTYGHYNSTDSNTHQGVLRNSDGQIARWMLCESKDLFGNWVRYYYSVDNTGGSNPGKQIYLDSILYTGHNEEKGLYRIVFEMKDRNPYDRPVNCNYGFKEETGKVLCNISITYRDSIVTMYYFETECGYSSNFKTRLKAVSKLDNLFNSNSVFQHLKNICSIGLNGYSGGYSRQVFSYYDAPRMDTLFGDLHVNNVSADNIKAFMLTPGFRIENVNHATALGLSHSSSWSVGGTLAAGLGPVVCLTSSSIGGNYQRSGNTSETLASLVDLDGDGLSDKVFVKDGNMYWRKQIYVAKDSIAFSAAQIVNGAKHFLVEKSTTNTFGVQASVHLLPDTIGISGSGNWSNTNSQTSTYFADVNGDGLVDIVSNGYVFFNHIYDGQPTFVPFLLTYNDDGEPVSEPENPPTNDCGGIIFDGEVNDSVACRMVWVSSDISHAMDSAAAYQFCQSYENNDDIMAVPELDTDGYHVVFYIHELDCSQRNLAKHGVPPTEAVRVWVAPDSGSVTLKSYIRLIEDTSSSRRQSRHADGITYTVQHSRNVTEVSGVLNSVEDRLLFSKYICQDCYRSDSFNEENYDTALTVDVERGDIFFFRLQSNDDKQFDNIEEHIKILLNEQEYTSHQDFVLTEYKYFQAPYDGYYRIDGYYDNGGTGAHLIIKQPEPEEYTNSIGNLSESGYLQKDSILLLAVTTNDVDMDWGSVDLKARIRFWSDSLPDTMTVWTPGAKVILHPEGSIWNNGIYQRLFGPLYNGWGQFAYNPQSSAANSQYVRLESLIPSVHTISETPSDTNGLRDRINRPIAGSGFDCQDIESFTGANGNMYCTINDSSCWVGMTADAEHGRWISFGAQNSIGSDVMSNSIQNKWYSNATQISEDSSVYIPESEYFDDPIPVVSDVLKKTIIKTSFSKSRGASFGIKSFGESGSSGENYVTMDYLDLNGDRYPDIIGPSYVQYRSQWGGLGIMEEFAEGIKDVSSSENSSAGVSFGASPLSHRRVISSSQGKAKYTLDCDGSLGGDLNFGSNKANSLWIDINGDGLPDYVAENGTVRLNVGYGFLNTENWYFDEIQTGRSTSRSYSLSASGVLSEMPILDDVAEKKFNLEQGSIQLGAGLGRSVNRVTKTFIDINGDGLPDMVWRTPLGTGINSLEDVLNPNDSVHIKINLGRGLWSDTYNADFNSINMSENYNESLNAGVTMGATVFGIFKLTGGVNGTPYSSSVNRDLVQLVDVNNDGLPDLVKSSDERTLKVRYNKGGKTNLLKTVTNFTGSRINIEYTLSTPCYEQPSRSWQMTQVSTKDPLNPNGGDTTVTQYAYGNPHYDRLERAFYGYGTIATKQINPSNNSIYRIVRRDFHNENVLVKGRPKCELTTDGQGNKYIEKVYQYNYKAYDGDAIDSCSGNAYSKRDRVVTRFYEGASSTKLTTAEAFEYDRYHNVTKYIDEGDTAYGNDGLYVDMTYLTGQQHNLIGLRDDYKVYATGTLGADWMRHTTLAYWPNGKLKRQTLHNGSVASDFEFWYDSYGNLERAKKPQNDSLQRMEYRYTYDALTHTYPVKIKNSHQDSVLTAYLLPFGKPTRVTDPGGSTMHYTYDNTGRLLTVTSPLNASGTPSLTNEYYPINYYHSNVHLTYGFSAHPYASTRHFDDNGILITETVVIADGFGRVIQTKKGVTSGNQQKMQVSGREFTDAFGRATGKHDVFCENIGSAPGDFNPYISQLIDTIFYDVLDRDIEVRQPSLGYVTTKQYDVQNDTLGHRRFTTTVTDPISHTTVQYSDYDGHQVQVTDATGGVTKMAYDALGQLLSSTDPEDFSTTYTYDRLGHLTERVHPDAGTTQYMYDAAGNMTQEITPLGNIFYSYTYQRLAQKRYSNIVENNVTYIYGTDGTNRGRPVHIEDGTGERTLSYDALGNVTEEKRIIALPGFEKVCIFLTRYHYDSWGRMLTMTYPDGEVVTYTYSYGGNLKTMYGDKGTAHYDYVTDITYNDFGQRSRIDYGNGTRAAYTYDVLHRLSLLRSVSSSGTMQIIKYTQDGVGNITEVYNRASAIGPLGGTYTNSHHYDALNRLTQSANSDNSYDILMEYSPSGRIAHKTATYSATYSANADLYYGYCDGNQPHAPKRVFNQNDNTLNELMWDIAGNLGQVNTAIDQIYNDTRFLFWTEDNRLHTVADNNWHSYYAYDHTGERTLKLTGKNSVIDVNADIMMTSSILEAVTLYPSPYVVLSNTGYTKHYYAGSDRLCARIGGGGIVELVRDDRLADRAEMLFQNCLNESLNRQLSGDDPECIHSFEFESGSLRDPIGKAPSMLNTTAKVDLSDFEPAIDHYSTANNPEPDVYYYHADHLGSASWITDASGIPLQHLQYLPFGESFINQRATGSTYNERFTFTGKEKDSETGFYYFGARYYDPSLSGLFISIDPMADKYPSLSPYAYCAWNPVKLVDPMGDSLKLVGSDECKQHALSQMQSKTNNLTFSCNDDGTVSYSGSPKTKMEEYMASILDNDNIHINLEVQTTNYNKKGNLKNGAGFYGNIISEDGNQVSTMQAINILASERYDRLCKNKGNMIWHEIAESFEGGIISLRNNTNAAPARFGMANSVYDAAHFNAGLFFPGNIISDHFMTYWYIDKSSNPPEYKQVELRTNYRYEK